MDKKTYYKAMKAEALDIADGDKEWALAVFACIGRPWHYIVKEQPK
jgi:hypothetical protein